MKKLNGVILDGKFYEVVEVRDFIGCSRCAFYNSRCKAICLNFEGNVIFRLNQKITDKINNENR